MGTDYNLQTKRMRVLQDSWGTLTLLIWSYRQDAFCEVIIILSKIKTLCEKWYMDLTDNIPRNSKAMIKFQ